MAVTPRLAAVVVIPILSFAVGYLLGAGSHQSEANREEVLANQRELMRLMREVPDTWQSDGRPSMPRLAGDPARGASDAGGVFRLPSLDPWITRIDQAVLRIEAAAERTHRSAPPNPTDVLRKASNPNLPRNDAELKRFIREYEAVEQTEYDTEEEYEALWDAFYSKYRYLPMDTVLERFGRPDDVQLGAGAATWEYYFEHSQPSGLTEDWGVTFDFYDGVLVEFYGYWNRIE